MLKILKTAGWKTKFKDRKTLPFLPIKPKTNKEKKKEQTNKTTSTKEE